MINSSDNLLYNLSYLSSVIHPVIILRLLEHRIFTPLFKKKSILTNPSTTSSNVHFPSMITTLPRPETLIQQRHSLTKPIKRLTRQTPSASIACGQPNLQINPLSELTLNSTNPTDLSLLLQANNSSTGNSNQPTRKWFWRNSEKAIQTNLPNDRNPLLQAIVEIDPISSTGSVPITTTAISTDMAGVGEIKLFEKELLNLPSFQLSDSQNPLLPSPTCLSYDFPTQFDSSNQQISNPSIVLTTSKSNQFEPTNNSHVSTLRIPSLALRTPSDDDNRSSSFVDNFSRPVVASFHKNFKNFFRSSKTVANMSNLINNRNQILTNLSKCNRNLFHLKISPHLSHSQPIVTENLQYNSSFLNHTEQTPLIDRRDKGRLTETSIELIKPSTPNHLPIDIDSLPRSRSCTEGNIQHDIDLPTPIHSSLQPNNSEIGSLRSSDSTASSLSVYLSNNPQLTIEQKNEITKSQESIFSTCSRTQKQRSIKSFIMAASTKDKGTKQDNDVLVLIASWVLRSPEDFQGEIRF